MRISASRKVATVPQNQQIFDSMADYEDLMWGDHMRIAEKMIPMLEKFIKEDGLDRKEAFRKAYDICDTRLSAFIIAHYVNQNWHVDTPSPMVIK